MSKNKNKNEPNFFFKVIKNGKVVHRCQTGSKRRFYNKARTIDWQKRPLKVYLKVHYGKHLSNFGKMEAFWNDGYYEIKDDFWLALEAFSEEIQSWK